MTSMPRRPRTPDADRPRPTDARLSRRGFSKAALALAGGALLADPGRAFAAAPLTSDQRVLFKPGESLNGVRYHTFRIPSIVRTTRGTLLAFAEGRVNGGQDYGNINTVFKRSTDDGKTWSKLGQVAGDGPGTWGNPTAVADFIDPNGRVVLFMSWNPAGVSEKGSAAGGGQPATRKITKYGDRRVRMSFSDDDGLHWSAPVDLTSTLTPPEHFNGKVWAFDAVGPGVGIQTRVSHPGRLIIPAVNRNFYSDDHGRTWKVARLGTPAHPMEDSGEATITELSDGTLYRNDRPSDGSKFRKVARGSIETGFSGYRGGPAGFVLDKQLPDPTCEGSTLYYNAAEPKAPSRIVFLNAASGLNGSTKEKAIGREKLNIRISTDEARTWALHRPLKDDAFDSGGYVEWAYTSMAKTADFKIAVLAEAHGGGHGAITFRRIALGWINEKG
jgi:sialidase-1